MQLDNTKRISKWYHGGLASAAAACCTHPLDLLKVHLQTHQGTRIGGTQMAVNIIRSQGLTALYNGLSASVGRQINRDYVNFNWWKYESEK
uniref:mitochondrial dicarboxylate carrier-like isoform X2 n=1 Tax=Ciona intestinalis TaxID=7719 RepID=UPI00089DB227|nr:mitochondrial dicarboxylate carrier-like isoform X2 [Ciona intestinalis]|eukprot:XP_018672302.1 mitochondrial dicarboxylate carrier-like isoform X2 [Ciona intestinalis]